MLFQAYRTLLKENTVCGEQKCLFYFKYIFKVLDTVKVYLRYGKPTLYLNGWVFKIDLATLISVSFVEI